MAGQGILERFPALRTRDLDEVREWLRCRYATRRIDLKDRTLPLDCAFNHCQFDSLQLTYVQFGAPITAQMEENPYFVQGFPLSGMGEVQWNRETIALAPERAGVIGGPLARANFDYDAAFTTLMLRIPPQAIAQRLSALLGRPVEPPLQIMGAARPDFVARQRRMVLFLAQELDLEGGPLPSLLTAEIEDAIIINYLLEVEHNYSGLLRGTARVVAPWQVRRAVDYIEQHWDQPITIETLTRITETSARSLFQLFKKTHDVSPMVYLGQVRLRHARELLSRPDPETSVTKVGFMCGFSNMGHFALKYHAAFGERPSETLRNSLK